MQRLGPYEVLEELARGAAGVVYRAHDPTLDRPLAIKLFRADIVRDATSQQRFLQEIRILARLRHPHVIGVHAAGLTDDGRPYVAMDLIEGGSLAERLEQHATIPVDAAVDLAIQLADALSYAHSQGVLHRDVKPQNVLLRGNQAVLTDFGVAKLLNEKAPDLTHSGDRVGTTVYMAPEQLRGEHDRVGPATDVYALGATLFQMLTGQVPYVGQTVGDVLERKQDTLASSVRAVLPSIDAELEEIVSTCLAEEIADRFPTAFALRARLRAWQEPPSERPVVAAPWRRRLQGALVGLLLGLALGLLVAESVDQALRREVYPRELPEATRALFQRGTDRFDRDDLAGAVEDMSAVIAAEPDCATAYYRRAFARRGLAQLAEARADLDRTIEIDPEYGEAYNLRAQLREDEAGKRADYDRAVALEPRQATFHHNRAAFHFKYERPEQAQADVARALERDPRFAQSLYLRGVLKMRANDLEGALADMGKALEYEPKSAEILNARGLLHSKRGDSAAAADDFTRAIVARLEKPVYHVNRASTHRERKDWTAALRDLNAALEIDPAHQPSFQLRAMVLLQLHRWSEGAADLEQAAELLPPDHPDRAPLQRTAQLLRAAVKRGLYSVDADSIELRTGPGMGYRVIADVKRGTTLKAIRRTRRWTKVEVKDATGRTYDGYVLTRSLAIVVDTK